MNAPTQPVTVRLADFGGPAIAGVKITARPSDVDFTASGIFVGAEPMTVETDATGLAVFNCFPNAVDTGLGTRGTTIRFTAALPSSRPLDVRAAVPNNPCNLVDILVDDDPNGLMPGELAVVRAEGFAQLAEDWATSIGLPDGVSKSAKSYAGDAAGSAGAAAGSAGVAAGSAVAAAGSAGAAAGSAGDSAGWAQTALDWATKVVGAVAGGLFSAKEYAQGSQAATGGSAKNWAQQAGADVTGAAAGSRSAKSWATDNLTPGGANLGGSAKDWASSAALPDGVSKSAKSYAADAKASRDAIDGRLYPGTYAVDPVTRPDATAIQDGDIFFTAAGVMKERTAGAWVIQNINQVDLQNAIDPLKGAALVGFRGTTVSALLARTWYVDSVNGNDANNGATPQTAFLTLAKVLTVLKSADTVFLARGSEWRESFDLGANERVTIDAFGTGAMPIINGADLIPGGTWVAVSGAVYQVDVVIPEQGFANRCYPGIFENGDLLYEFDKTLDGLAVQANAIAAVQARPGSFLLWSGGSVTGGWAAGATLRFYVQASDAGNPAANGKTYEVRKRSYTLRVNRSTVRNVVARRQFHHDGVCLSAQAAEDGPGGSYFRVVFDQMARHSVIDPVASFEQCVTSRKNTRYEGYGFHAYKSVLGNFSPRYKGCISINIGSGWGTHSANAGVSSHKRLVYEDCVAIGCTTGFGGFDFDVGEYVRCKTLDCLSDFTASQGVNVSTTLTECEFKGATYRPFAAPAAGRKCTIRRSKMACQTPDGYFFIQNDVDCGTLEVLDGSEVVWHRSYLNIAVPALFTTIFNNRSWQKITLKDSIFSVFPSNGMFVKTLGTGVVTAWDVSNCIFAGFLNGSATYLYKQGVRGSFNGVTTADMFGVAGWTDNQLIDARKIYRALPVRDGFDKRNLAPVPRSGKFNAITYSGTGNTQPRGVVAVGKTIALMTAGPDAFTRTIDTPASEMFGIGFDQTSVTYTAVGANGLMRRSTAGSFGTVWATVGAAVTAQTLRGCAGKAATSLMVAVGDNNTVLRSADGGATWAAATNPPATAGTNWKAVACDGTTFIAVGPGGKTAWTTDGNVWTEVTTGTTDFRAITAGGAVGTFVAVGSSPGAGSDAEIKSTANSGVAWTARTSNCQSDLVSIAYGGLRYVAVADSNSAVQGPEVITSTDFINWAPLGVDAPFAITGVCYAGYQQLRWTMCGNSNVFGQSSDGQAWSFVQALEFNMPDVAKARSGIEGYLQAML